MPIIGLTAHALASDRSRCLEARMDSYLSKPFDADELIFLIEKLAKPQYP
jgi:CheY-like chemotaxis protein